MSTTTIHQAKTNLSKLIEQAERGEEVLIARGKTVVAKIVPVSPAPKKRKLDLLKGKFRLGEKFFEPLPDEELDA
ncbi:MAG: type II toxin-antitoxin system prevent-host-death family antitoxin, partial [Acidobacteria bacterium]|nr:type II toxin-antitoxin system prevent-host-death family antitoxin [Acidobacteriota bacterium]